MSFDGFISYSHAADGRLAPAVQRGLHRLAKPWHRRRALWIFRDQTGLSVTPALWAAIQKALDDSDYFVLMASPEASGSPWVNREIEHWVAHKSPDRILPVVTDGEWEWDPVAKDFSAASTAVPRALRGVFAEEPLYLDLRWARDDQHLSLRHSRFRDAIAQLAAPMHGVSKDDLEGEDVQQHRRAARLRMAAVTSLVVLSGLAMLAGVFAARNAAHASAFAAEARNQHREATQMRDSAAYFADEALRQEGLAREQQDRAKEAAAEAERQEKLALQQKGLAGQASAEAARQLAKADRAAGRARAQERLARKQSELAAESAQEMRKSEDRAKQQEEVARQQQLLAAAATEEAQEQEKLADAARADANAQKGKADQQQRISIARALVNEAQETARDDPPAAMRLGVAAQKIYPEAETRRSVAALISANRYAGGMPGVSQIAYGPGNLLVSLNQAGTVSLWDVEDRANPVRLSSIGNAATSAGTMTVSRDGTMVAVTQEGAVALYDVSDPSKPSLLATLPAERRFQAATFSPDGRTLATGNQTGADGYASLWDLADRRNPVEISTLNGPGDYPATVLEYTPDGRSLVTSRGSVVVWDVSDRTDPEVRSTIDPAPDTSWGGVAMSPAEPTLVVGGSGGWVYIYDLSRPAEPQQIATAAGLDGQVYRFSFSADGRILAGTDNMQALVWKLGSSTPIELTRLQDRQELVSVAISKDGRTLATTDRYAKASLWDVTGYAVPRPVLQDQANEGRMLATRQTPDSRTVITVGSDGKAVLWDVRNRAKPVRKAAVPVHSRGSAESAAVSGDGRVVVAVDWSGRVEVTDLTNPSAPVRLASFDAGRSGSIQAISPDSRTLVMGGLDERTIWDLTDRSHPKLIRALATDLQRTGPVEFGPDGRTLAIVEDKMVWLADVERPADPQHLSFLDGHRERVTSLAFSADGAMMAVGSLDGTVSVWDVADRTQPHRLSTLEHSITVSAVAFSPDSATVAVASQEGVAVLWDVAQPSRPVQLMKFRLALTNEAHQIVFSPDARSVTIASDIARNGGAFIGIWDLSALDALRADPSRIGCEIAGRGLTAEEWKRRIPELPYERTC